MIVFGKPRTTLAGISAAFFLFCAGARADTTLQSLGKAYQTSHIANESMPPDASPAYRSQVNKKIWAPALKKYGEDQAEKQKKFIKGGLTAGQLALKQGAKRKGAPTANDKASPAENPAAMPKKAAGREVHDYVGPVEQGGAKDVGFNKANAAKKPGPGLAPATPDAPNSPAPATGSQNQHPADTGGANAVQFGK